MSKLEELIEKLCPDGVEYVRIEEICNISRGRVMSKDYLKENIGDYPVYSSQTENNGELGRISTYDFDGEYLTWTTDGANAGTVFYRIGKFSITNVCGLLKVTSKEVVTKYLYYTLNTEAPKYVNKGMGNPKLMSNVMGRIKVQIPPLEIQEEIVRILDSFIELTAELQAELQARRQQYEYYRETMLCNVNGKDGVILDMLSQPVTDGPHTTPTFVSKGIPFISATAVYNGKIHLEDAQGLISEEFDAECSKKYKPQKNDVFMVKSGSTTGKVAFVDTDDCFNIWSPLAAMRTNEQTTPRYLYHLLQTKSIQNQVLMNCSKGSQPNLSMRKLEQFKVVIPPLSEQERIVAILDRFDKLCNDITTGLPAEIEARQKQYEYYRDKLLNFKEMD